MNVQGSYSLRDQWEMVKLPILLSFSLWDSPAFIKPYTVSLKLQPSNTAAVSCHFAVLPEGLKLKVSKFMQSVLRCATALPTKCSCRWWSNEEAPSKEQSQYRPPSSALIFPPLYFMYQFKRGITKGAVSVQLSGVCWPGGHRKWFEPWCQFRARQIHPIGS